MDEGNNIDAKLDEGNNIKEQHNSVAQTCYQIFGLGKFLVWISHYTGDPPLVFEINLLRNALNKYFSHIISYLDSYNFINFLNQFT